MTDDDTTWVCANPKCGHLRYHHRPQCGYRRHSMLGTCGCVKFRKPEVTVDVTEPIVYPMESPELVTLPPEEENPDWEDGFDMGDYMNRPDA